MYWITKNLATSSMSEFMQQKRDAVSVDVQDLIDGEGNDPEVFLGKVKEVESLINANKKVCVCCGSGISRSNAVALAYLLRSGMEFDEAYNLIKEKVPIVEFDMALVDLVKKIA